MDSGLDAGASPRNDEGDKFEIVLDHHHRIALRHQLVQHFRQLLDVVEVRPGGGLVEDDERVARGIA